jgi:hypothetical protein
MESRWETLKTLRWRPRGGRERPLCAASGLVRVAGAFWSVGDDLHHAVRIPDGRTPATGHRLFAGDPPADHARRKKLKRDLESIFDLGKGRLIAFPSGSKRRRARGALIRVDAQGRFKNAREINFRPLIDLLEEKIPDLNIEGGFTRGGRLVLLQRGNGKAGVNAVVKLSLNGFMEGLRGRWRASRLRLKVKRKTVGRWGRVALGFTDGFFHDGVAYFAAAAETGKDTYKDGKVLGSVLGALPKGKPPVILSRLAGEKIEGLALRSVKDGRLEICAVTDNDDPRRPSRLLRTWI